MHGLDGLVFTFTHLLWPAVAVASLPPLLGIDQAYFEEIRVAAKDDEDIEDEDVICMLGSCRSVLAEHFLVQLSLLHLGSVSHGLSQQHHY